MGEGMEKVCLVKHIIEFLTEKPKLKKRLQKYYKKYGAHATRRFFTQVSSFSLKELILLTNAELREILGVPADHAGYALAVEAHRLAWTEAGWHARPWYVSPGGDDGTGPRGKGGGKKSISRAQAYDALRRGSK